MTKLETLSILYKEQSCRNIKNCEDCYYRDVPLCCTDYAIIVKDYNKEYGVISMLESIYEI